MEKDGGKVQEPGSPLKLNLKLELKSKALTLANMASGLDKRYDSSKIASKLSNHNDNASMSPPITIRDIEDGDDVIDSPGKTHKKFAKGDENCSAMNVLENEENETR